MGEEFLEKRKMLEEFMLFSLPISRHGCHVIKDRILKNKYIYTKGGKQIIN